MLGRRFLVLVAVLIGLTVIAASLAPRQPAPSDQRAAEATPIPSPVADGPATPPREVLSTKGKPRRVTVDRGALLDLVVDGDELDSVSFEGEVEIVTEETNARFNVYADTPGQYEIRLVEADRPVGTLVVRGD
jgi:hypothetical protein